ncbi:hypothetical protein [Kineococcus esterisolvens]|uniref:hypothetical protein n=1 Tax=unclassified Kineococcus TaxID=2621656 RepID=UPI003D7DC07B
MASMVGIPPPLVVEDALWIIAAFKVGISVAPVRACHAGRGRSLVQIDKSVKSPAGL